MKASILAIMLMLSCVGLADTWTDPETGRTWSYRMIDDTAEIIQGEEYKDWSGDLIVPDKLGDIVVSRIGDCAFSGCNKLSGEVAIPDGVTSISYGAFQFDTNIISVTLPDNLKVINRLAFYGCSSLSTIKIPNGVETIDSYAFRGCESLQALALPNSVVKLGWSAFENCTSLKAVVLSDGLSQIDGGCFRGCTNLQRFILSARNENFVVVDGVLYSKDMTRLICVPAGMESINIPDTVTVISDSAFYGCSRLKTITLPEHLKEIGGAAFCGCTSLAEIIIPDEVATVPYSAFQDCMSITNVVLPASLSIIGSCAFAGCPALEHIDIPSGVEHIDAGAFADTGFWDLMPDGVVIINGIVLSVKGACPSEIVLPDGVKEIADSAFEGCSDLMSITIPDSVDYIGWRAFADCIRLQSVDLPNGLTWLQSEMFFGCRSLRSVTIKEGITDLNWSLFYGCDALESVHLPESLLYLDGGSFEGCHSLTNINIPASMQEFYNADILAELPLLVDNVTCPGLKLIDGWVVGYDELSPPDFLEIPNVVRGIANGAFSGCDSLITVTVPGCINRVSGYAFADCANLLVVDIEEGVKSIGESAFSGCVNLVSLTLPESAEDVSYNIVDGTALINDASDGAVVVDGWILDWKGTKPENVVLPEGVRHFPQQFWWQFGWNGGAGIHSIVIPESMTNVAALAFACCDRLERVNVLGVNTTIDSMAFLGCPVTCRVEMSGNKSGYRFTGWVSETDATDFNRFPDFNYTNGVLYVEGSTWYIEQYRTNETVRIKIGDEYLLKPNWIEATYPSSVATPIIATINGGDAFWGASCEVMVSCDTDGAIIYYSTDGTAPRLNEAYRYWGNFSITNTTTIIAVAKCDNMISDAKIVTITRRNLTIPVAVNAEQLEFATGGYSDWMPIYDETSPNGASARSGIVADGMNTWLETSVVGAGEFGFYWKVACEEDYITHNRTWDRLAVYTNGIEVARIDGTNSWEYVTIAFDDDGCHQIRWEFLKDDENDESFPDVAWVRDVSWSPTDIPDEILTLDTQFDVGEMPEKITVQPGVTLCVMVESEPTTDEIAELVARVAISPKSAEQSSEYFKVVGIYDSEIESVVMSVVIDEAAIELPRSATEILDAVMDKSFVGGEVTITSAKPGLWYGIVVVDDLSRLNEAAESVSFVQAGEDGVKIDITRPEGPTAFFKIVVRDEVRE